MKQTYLKYIGLHLLLFLCSLNFYAQDNSSIWLKTSRDKVLRNSKPILKQEVKKAKYYQLDVAELKAQLQNTPNRKNTKVSGIIVKFPDKEGELQAYRIKEAPLFESSFQEKHPDMRCYIGKNVNNSGETIRFSITPHGFHGMTLSSNKSVQFIDPVTYGSKNYIVYTKSDLSNIRKGFECKYIDNLAKAKSNSREKLAPSTNANDGILRTYELALASTGEYSEYHFDAAGQSGGTDTEKKNAVKAAMMVTMNRVNGIFERDLSLTMTMVENEDIIFLDATTDPYSNVVNLAMLTTNQTTIDNAIGSGNYDIGHVFSTDNGGLAVLPSPCDNSNKAKGATGQPVPEGDLFNIEYVAHEMGHQFGANHTWSSNNGSCSGTSQFFSAAAFEPGSGSTIMAYAGLCAPDNVQSNGDDYFHLISIQEIWANISADNCHTESPAGNTAPSAIAGSNYTIPVSTPYKLTGNSSDPDPEGITTHTYTWEQYDSASSQGPILESNPTGPLVRSYPPTSNPIRYVPNLDDLRFSNGSTTWEKLASVARTINYELTVRDNGSGGDYGQTDSDGMVINVVDIDGPFQVTSQNTTGINYPVGSTQTVTWDVAGTTGGGINTSDVNIWLSTDGGLTYPTFLLNTTNDGSADITLPPGIGGLFCRIMVEASNNIFFAINSQNFSIGTFTTNCTQYASTSNLGLSIPDNDPTGVTNTINITDSKTISFVKINTDVTHTWISDLVIKITHPNGSTFTEVWNRACDDENDLNVIFEDGASSPIICAEPTSGTYMPSSPLSVFSGLDSAGDWEIEISDNALEDDTGVLNNWYIEICEATLNTPSFENFNNLKVYPNPNTGEFTISLDNTQSAINVDVYDIRGRQIYSNQFKNSGSFNQNINLKNAQSGMYILKVGDGLKQSTKKIIIE